MLIFILIFAAIFILILFAVYRAPNWLWTIFIISFTVLLYSRGIVVENQKIFYTIPLGVAVFLSLLFSLLAIPLFRRYLFVKPIFSALKKQKLHISGMEQQALSIGNMGFEKGLFFGHPDWQALRNLSPFRLSKEEQRFLSGPVEELCRITNDWEIRYRKRKIPDALWDFATRHQLFRLRSPREYGGASFSFQAQSTIVGKIASRSIDVATMVELPTSLWPDEIIEKYGSKEQKEYYMPRFAESKEIVAFAITGVSNGSDATAMRDVGRVEYGMYQGKKVVGIRLDWHKRYITFATKATLIVLGFRLLDPENILKKGEDVGITLALIPSSHPGIRIGRRHLPTNVAFPNGPIWGENVFIPIDWIIGGVKGAGQGWKMILECLFVGRAVALPAISVAVIKVALRYSAQYARIRRQFGSPIGKFEGIEEPLTYLIETAYLTESARVVTNAMIDNNTRSHAVSYLMKYKTTEYARQAVDRAIDIHGGRGVCDGPSNYLMSAFLAAPIGVTVEGANIVIRSVITFAQTVLQSHPYIYEEFESCGDNNTKCGLKRFEVALSGHISFLVSNVCRAFLHNLTGGFFGHAPNGVPHKIRRWYRRLWKESCNFAYIADVTTILLGSRLKKKQKLGGRLADALAELYLLSTVLKRYEDDGFPESDYPIVELCMKNGLYRFQEALNGAIHNFPISGVRLLLSILTFPFGVRRAPALDSLSNKIVQLVLTPGEVLDRLTQHIYLSNDPDDITGRLEVAFKKAVEVEDAQKKLDLAVRRGEIKRIYGIDWVTVAEKKGILTSKEATDMRELEKLTEKVLAVDHFDPKDILSE